jgi:Holliday junction resolvase
VSSNAAAGRDFEVEIAEFLRAAGFEVTKNAKVARPRQTDIFARNQGNNLLVEAKNQKRKVDVNDVDSLRSRLNRTSSDIVGVIFATSGLTQGAIEAIEIDRRREILAFVTEEIESLRSNETNLQVLIERKRSELRVNGRAWFGTETHSEFLDAELPLCNVRFRWRESISSYFELASDFNGPFFSLEIPGSGYGNLGAGVRLSIRLALNTARDIRNIVGYLHEKFGLSSKGMFLIQQSHTSWQGVGINNLIQAIECWGERYANSASKAFHHSEVIVFFDQFRNGWMELSCQQRLNRSSGQTPERAFLHGAELVIQLPGVPVDTSPLVKLCQYTGNDWAIFEDIEEPWSATIVLRTPIRLEPVGLVVNKEPIFEGDERDTVVGVVGRNPFYKKKKLPSELLEAGAGSLAELVIAELLICSLKDWYEDGDVVDHYVLEGFEVTVGGVGRIIRPFGTWNRLIKKQLRPTASK